MTGNRWPGGQAVASGTAARSGSTAAGGDRPVVPGTVRRQRGGATCLGWDFRPLCLGLVALCGGCVTSPPALQDGVYRNLRHEYALHLPAGWEPVKAVPDRFLARRSLTEKYEWVVGLRTDAAFLSTDTRAVIAVHHVTTVSAEKGSLTDLVGSLRNHLKTTERAAQDIAAIRGYRYEVLPSEDGAGLVQPVVQVTYRMVNEFGACQCEIRYVAVRVSRNRLRLVEVLLLSDADWYQDARKVYERVLQSLQPVESAHP